MNEFNAPGHWQAIDFISDLHLSPRTPRTFEAWASHLRHTKADAVFMLGDLFEVWLGDDAIDTVPFARQCADVLRETSGRVALAFMAGNRDFLVGERMLANQGVQALPDPTALAAFGQRVLLTHGDALCLADTDYQLFRAQVRNSAWQDDFLAKTLDERWRIARELRDGSEQLKRSMPASYWADVDVPAALQWLQQAGAATLVHGHTHRPQTAPLAPGAIRHVLTDWDLEEDARPPRAEVLRFTAQGFERRAPSTVSDP